MADRAGQSEPPPAAGRSGRRARTREKFLTAVTELLRHEGTGALSVTAIARRVGVHHSLFYQHFKGVDAALGAAAGSVLEHLAPVDAELRRELMRRAVTDRRQLARYFEGAFERWMAQRPFVELLLAHRLERSAMGDALRGALQGMRNDLTTELWELSTQLGVHASYLPETQALADLHLTHWLWALESLIEGRVTDRSLLASMLADLFHSTNLTFFERATLPGRDALIAAAFTPERLAQLYRLRGRLAKDVLATDDEALLARAGGLQPLVDSILHTFPMYFVPGAARTDAVVHFAITHGGQEVRRYLVIQDQSCRVSDEPVELGTRLEVRESLRTMLRTATGAQHFEEAYRVGDLRLGGDILFAVRLLDCFLDPGPGPDVDNSDG